MALRHALLFSFLALIGGFLGGLVSRPAVVSAQTQGVPPVRFVNDIQVPNEGLRFVDPNNRLVAFMGIQGGNCVFALLNSQERPSISFVAGVGGVVSFSSLADGAQLEMASASGSTKARLSATSIGATLEAEALRSVLAISNTGSSSHIAMPGGAGRRGIDLVAGPSSSLTLNNGGGTPSLNFEGAVGGGSLTVRDGTGKVTATVGSSGVFTSLKDGKQVWRAPAAGD
jgi:hypothetical protein